MNVKSKGLLFGFLGATLLLSACNHYVAKTNEKVEAVLERVEEYKMQSEIPDLPQPVDTVRVQNDIWLGNSSVKIMEGDALPARFEQDDSITLAIAQNADLATLAQEITDLTGIVVRLDDLKAENAVPEETVAVNYSGKLSGLLNYLANRYEVWWRYRNGQITFFTNETRVFTIYALPTETKLSANLKGASMGSDIPDVGSSSMSMSADLALWDNLEKGITQVLGDQGKATFSKPTGTVTVTASPFVMQKVASYISTWNEKLSRQVAISVKLLQVQLNNADSYGLDLGVAFNSNNAAIDFAGPIGTVATEGAVSGALAMTVLRPGRWTNTNAVIQALSTQGKTSLVTSASVTTLNNRPAPVQLITSQNYVKKVTVTNNYGSSTTTSDTDLDTDTLNYGFSMEILPRILDHGRLLVMFSMTLSDLLDLERFSTGGDKQTSGDDDSSRNNDETTTVQLPKMQMRGFMQEIAMTSGSTLVLTGFEQVINNTSTSGIGEAKVNLLGGQAYDQTRRDVLVILITPEVLESPMSPEARMREF